MPVDMLDVLVGHDTRVARDAQIGDGARRLRASDSVDTIHEGWPRTARTRQTLRTSESRRIAFIGRIDRDHPELACNGDSIDLVPRASDANNRVTHAQAYRAAAR